MSAEYPLFLVFTIVDCNGFDISIGTAGGHSGDRLGAGVDRVGRGDGTIPQWDLPVGMMDSPRLGGAGDNAQPGELRLVNKRIRRHDGGAWE